MRGRGSLVSRWLRRMILGLVIGLFAPVLRASEFSSVINAPPAVVPDNTILTDGTQLNVFEGGAVGGDLSIGQPSGPQAVEVNVSGGVIGNNPWETVDVWQGGVLNVSGGEVRGNTVVRGGGIVRLTGGVLQDAIATRLGRFEWAGGRIARSLDSRSDGLVQITGGEWRVDGVPVESIPTDFRSVGPNGTGPRRTIAGVLADGQPFILSGFDGGFFDGATHEVVTVAVPPADGGILRLPGNASPIGLRPGQSVLLEAGGTLPDYVTSLEGEVTVDGGAIGHFYRASGGVLDVFDGTVGREVFLVDGVRMVVDRGFVDTGLHAASGSSVWLGEGTVNGGVRLSGASMQVHGGHVPATAFDGSNSYGIRMFDQAELAVYSGEVERVSAEGGSRISIAGGSVGSAWAEDSSAVHVTGGKVDWVSVEGVGSRAVISGGYVGRLDADESVGLRGGVVGTLANGNLGHFEVFGSDFRLNGASVTALTELSPGSTFTAILSDGSPLIWANTELNNRNFVLSSTPPSLTETPTAPVDLALIDTATESAPYGLAPGQRLRVRGGTTLVSGFQAIDATIDLEDGTFGESMRLSGTVLNMSGGTVDARATALQGSVINLSGGEVDRWLELVGSELNMTGGSVTRELLVSRNSHADLSAGYVHTLDVTTGGVATVSGGRIGSALTALEGGHIDLAGGEIIQFGITSGGSARMTGGFVRGNAIVSFGGSLERVGGEFRLDDTPQPDGVLPPRSDYILSGTLEDGTVFVDASLTGNSIREDTVTLTSVPLPSPVPSVVVAEGDPVPKGVRPGQTVTLLTGAAMGDAHALAYGDLVLAGGAVGNYFQALGGTVRIDGGSTAFQFSSYDGTEVELVGGSIGRQFRAFAGSRLTMTGGQLGPDASAFSGSVIRILGGEVDGQLVAGKGSDVEVSGGRISSFEAKTDSDVRIAGGRFIGRVDVNPSARAEIIGGEFRLDGAPIAELPAGLPSGSTFTATLADGSVFILREVEGDRVAGSTTTLVPQTLPPISANPIVAPTDPVPFGLRSGESLVLGSGASTVDGFAALDAQIEVDGGVLGDHAAFLRTHVVLTQGSIGAQGSAYDGSTVTVDGGTLGAGFRAYVGSTLDLAAGTLPGLLTVDAGATLRISGTAFYRNGVDFTDTLTPGVETPFLDSFGTLAGMLTDGSPFEFRISSFPLGGVSSGANILLTLIETAVFAGDYNSSGQVEQGDLDIVLQNWGTGTFTGDENALVGGGPFDGTVDQNELDGVLQNWGSTSVPSFAGSLPEAVPEPATIALLTLGTPALLSRRLRLA